MAKPTIPQEYVVPPGKYFMMGDNRDNSQDSRYLDAVGFVPEENFIGPVVLRFWNDRGLSLDADGALAAEDDRAVLGARCRGTALVAKLVHPGRLARTGGLAMRRRLASARRLSMRCGLAVAGWLAMRRRLAMRTRRLGVVIATAAMLARLALRLRPSRFTRTGRRRRQAPVHVPSR